jgi:transposase InsO family protein
MDLFTREIVGWHLSLRHTQELTITALKDALVTRHFPNQNSFTPTKVVSI